MNTQESVPQVDGPAEHIPDKGDDNDCIITNYIPPTKEYTTVVIGNSKGLKAKIPTPLAKNCKLRIIWGYYNQKHSCHKILSHHFGVLL